VCSSDLRFNKTKDIATYMIINHPELVEDDVLRPNDTICLRIPVKAPEGSIYRTETALDTLERVKKFSQEWINEGHINGANTHNVSATVSIDKGRMYNSHYKTGKDVRNTIFDEWEAVGAWMWNNRNVYNGLSVLNYDGGSYTQAPFEDITEEKYNDLISHLKSVDLRNVIEMDDTVDFGAIQACGGGACEVNI
jgi:ribonucleoside-diphosphate reductase alpha chain